jgi:ABC-type multidrug transport system fused ATPase/permease subunit
LVYLFYFLTVVLQKKRINKFEKSNQVMYFVYKYKLDIKKINMKKFVQVISITNSLIIALSFTATFLSNNFWLGMLIGLIILIPLMLLCYSFIGKYLQKESR